MQLEMGKSGKKKRGTAKKKSGINNTSQTRNKDQAKTRSDEPSKKNKSFFRKIVNFVRTLIAKVWIVVSIVAVLFGLAITFLELQTKISIEHNSKILPANLTALPVKIMNEGLLPVYVERIEFLDDIKTLHGAISTNNKYPVYVFQKLRPGKSIETICDRVNFRDPPISGSYKLRLFYQTPILKRPGEIDGQFWIYRNKDSTYTWTNQPFNVRWPVRDKDGKIIDKQ